MTNWKYYEIQNNRIVIGQENTLSYALKKCLGKTIPEIKQTKKYFGAFGGKNATV